MRVVYEQRSDDFYCRDVREGGLTLGYIPHLHAQIELVFVTAGKTRVWVDNHVYDIGAGDVIIVFPNQVHRFETVEHEQYVILKFNPDILPELINSFSKVPVSNQLTNAANDPHLNVLIDSICKAYSDNAPYKEQILHGYLLSFLGHLLRQMTLEDAQIYDYHVLGKILNYCIAHSTEELSLTTLERELHISKYYISHMMSAKLHMGFNDYVNSLRVSNACKLLRKTDFSITEISERVGFNTMRTFNRAFSKQMGQTPREYRLAHATKNTAQ